MVFHPEGRFQQFPHCKFRENVVRLLHIPSLVDLHRSIPDSPTHLFLVVNKFGKVGLYHPEKFSLLHTYCLDLSVSPEFPQFNVNSNNPPITPKCEKTHLVTDAVYSSETCCVIFSTTKCLLQWYDIGEIQKQDIGLGLFPRKEFLALCDSSFPVTNIPNKGHVECHRLLGLQYIPSCLKYHGRKLIIGDVDGGVTLIGIPTTKYPLGRRKIRGRLHKIYLTELPQGVVQYYKAHHCPITDIQLIPERSLILTASKDKKFSVYVKDVSDTPMESIIVSISKGVNSIAYSRELKMIATGSDDYVVRLFNQFVMKMPQMEMFGHKSPVINVKFVQVDFFVVGAEQGDKPVLLLSFSADTELRAWDPLTFICLQSLYLSFPIGSTIMCKTPEFATKSLLVFQPTAQVLKADSSPVLGSAKQSKNKSKRRSASSSIVIVLLYCNSYARIPLEREGSTRWPGIDYDKFIREFEELSMEYEQKLKEKLKPEGNKGVQPIIHVYSPSPSPSVGKFCTASTGSHEEEDEFEETVSKSKKESDGGIQLTKVEMSEIERKVGVYMKEILALRQTIKEATGQGSRPISSEMDTGRRFSESPGGEEEEEECPRPAEEGTLRGVSNPLKVSIQATNKYFEFRRSKQNYFKGLPKSLQTMLSYGGAFNQYPLMELDPIEFSRGNLPIPEEMKKQLGIVSINRVQDLLTPEAQKYLGVDLSSSRSTIREDNGVRPTGSKTSTGYNFNHSPQKKKRSKAHQRHGPSWGQDHQSETAPAASRFTVVGQKIRNAYEDDNTMMSPIGDEFESEEDEAPNNYANFY